MLCSSLKFTFKWIFLGIVFEVSIEKNSLSTPISPVKFGNNPVASHTLYPNDFDLRVGHSLVVKTPHTAIWQGKASKTVFGVVTRRAHLRAQNGETSRLYGRAKRLINKTWARRKNTDACGGKSKRNGIA